MSDLSNEDKTIVQVVAALEYLKNVSEKEGLDDVHELIDCTFRMCLNTHMILKRSGYSYEEEVPGKKISSR